MYDHRVALVVGTRPEAIKLAPLAKALMALDVRPRVILTGQHPNLSPSDYGMPRLPALELGCAGVSDPNVHVGRVARAIGGALEGVRLVVVQGDTSSALGGALGAVQSGIPVAHVEAGLRSHDRRNPWPEEDFRTAIDAVSALLFAPTELSAANIRREGHAGTISVTGNTGIDALVDLSPLLTPRSERRGKRRLLVTCHRRESWNEGLVAIAACLAEIARRSDVAITFVLHPNPRVSGELTRLLGELPNLELHPPCSHLEMLQLMRDSDLILSDSGGMQEEAPALGVPLLILRDRTERPECIASGNAILVGRSPERIQATVTMLLDTEGALDAMSSPALPFADGQAAQRIAREMETWLSSQAPPIKQSEPLSPSPPSATARAAP